MSLMKNTESTWANDALASIVVFLVAVPLCLGIAVACGLPPALGLASGIIGGIVVGVFSGCALQVSGPAAGLIAITWEIIHNHGIETFGLIVLCAGLVQVLMGVFGLGRWFRAVSPAVIQGMLSGIGVLIFASQFHIMLDDVPLNSGIENLLAIPQTVYKGIFPMDGSNHHLAALVGFLTIGAIVVWEFMPKKVKMIPGALVGVSLASIVAYIFQFPVNYVTVPENLLTDFVLIDWGQIGQLGNPSVLLSIAALAFIASAEALLTATAVDRMQGGPPTVYNKEIVAQGIGNTLAGCIGALPMTGVIVRSTANLHAGGQTNKAAIMHGFWILLFVLFLPSVLGYIPVASLAAILVYIGYRLINPQAIKELLKFGKSEVVIYLLTVGAIVSTELLTGILIGLALSAAKLLYIVTHLDVEVSQKDNDILEIDVHGSATFFTLPTLAETMERIPPGQEVHLYLVDLNYIDHACLEFLMGWEKQYEDKGGRVIMEWDHVMDRFKQPKTKERVSTTKGK